MPKNRNLQDEKCNNVKRFIAVSNAFVTHLMCYNVRSLNNNLSVVYISNYL